MTDTKILALYSAWSEAYYCAGFLTPSPETVKAFRNWLNTPKEESWSNDPLQDYEQEMLKEFHKQEGKWFWGNQRLNLILRNWRIRIWRIIYDST